MFQWIINIFRRKGRDTISIEMAESQMAISVHNQIKQDPAVIVLKESQDRINRLKIYANYFDHRTITDILNQTEMVHDVFANDKELSYKKLDQFHYYYTDHLLELLAKLKISKDENLSVISTQVKSLDNKIATGKKKLGQILSGDIKKLNNEKAQYAQNMSLQLASIYNCLIDNFNDFRFKRRTLLSTYTAKHGLDLAWSLPSELFLSSISHVTDNPYKYDDYTIERKLMGRLQKHLFMIEFIGICYSGDSSFELYKIADSDDYFIYVHEQGLFKFITYNTIQDLCNTDNTKFGNLKQEIQVMEERKTEISAKMTEYKRIDSKTEDVLKQTLAKIEDVELLNKLSEVDLERKNLESILNVGMINV